MFQRATSICFDWLEIRMKKLMLKTAALVTLSLAAFGFYTSAQAATSWAGSWNYGSCSAQGTGWGNSYNCTDTTTPSDANLNLSGWSSDLSPSVTNFTSSAVVSYSGSGLGITSREECSFSSTVCEPGNGPHAADNYGNLDAFLLSFSGNPSDTVSVALNSITIGWNGTDNATSSSSVLYNDSDISVYYYTGTTAPDMTAVNASNLTSNGWTLLNHYSNVGSSSNNTVSLGNTGENAISSSWWLVSASNSTTGTKSSSDAFKLMGAAGTGSTTTPPTPGVPEPGSLALASLALLAVVYARRPSKQKQ
jgi:PEP-CTERM motif